MNNKRISIKRVITAVILISLVVLGWWITKLVWFKPLSINHFYERTLFRYALKDPQQMSQIGIFKQFGLKLFDDDLTDVSFDYKIKLYNYFERELRILRSYDRLRQSEKQLMSTDILDWYIDNIEKGKEFMYQGFPINKYLGLQKQLPEYMSNTHIIAEKKDAENYIKRLTKFDTYFDQVIDSLKIQETKGIIPPTYIITEAVEDMKSFVSVVPESSALYTSFSQKLLSVKMDGSLKESLSSKVMEEIENTVYPSYKKLIAYYESLLPKSKDYVGVWSLPDGDRYFEYMLRNQATLDITPEEAYIKLTKEVNSINAEIKKLSQQAGGKNTGTQTKSIATIEDCQQVVEEMYKKLPALFGNLPKAKVEVRYYPNTGGNNAGSFQYNASDITGSIPATIYVSDGFSGNSTYTMKWVLYHEGVPGHHLQKALTREMTDVPNFRKIIPFSAFTEGWATYAQNIPWEYGITSDPNSELEMLKTKLFHAGRAVIDVGVNYKHWTREEAVQYALQNNVCDAASARYFAEYCTAYPGIECPYEIGYLKICELRDQAKAQLGDKFDIRDFHDTILQNGEMPLSLLEKQVNKYIEVTKQ